MPKFVSFVFKVLILTVLIAVFTSLLVFVIDVFVTTNRIQTLCDMIRYDVCQHNCMMNTSYESYRQELWSISSRSNSMKVITDVSDTSAAGYNTAPFVGQPVNDGLLLYSGNTPSTNLIAKSSTDKPKFIKEGLAGTGEYNVADYGDIMHLRVATVITPHLVDLTNMTDGSTNMSELQWTNWTSFQVNLDYSIPALIYMK